MPSNPENSFHPRSREEWRSWLSKNHEREEGIWLISFKKATGKQAFDYDASVEEALCFGWIDSKPNKLDAERTMLWFAPRKNKTGWSRANKIRIERLIQTGRMRPPGLEKIERAKKDGSWTALDSIESLEYPPDLKTAFKANPLAERNFTAFPRSAKRGILEWIISAKKPETRAKRIEETVRLAGENLRANQWRK